MAKIDPTTVISMLYIELDKKRGDTPLFSVYNDGEQKTRRRRSPHGNYSTKEAIWVERN